ncbi:mCG123854 [Mus musculus]|nr:mCG123854 [Mus musculus]
MRGMQAGEQEDWEYHSLGHMDDSQLEGRHILYLEHSSSGVHVSI